VTVSSARRDRLVSGRKPARVAVLDDHEAVRLGVERLLQRATGIEAVAALDDVRALFAFLEREDVDVVVLDYDLGRGDGLATCVRVKQLASRPAVVIYSGYAGPQLMLAASVAQADAVVDKAEPVEVLITSIRRLAGGERLLERPAPDVVEAACARLNMNDLPIMAMLIDGASTLEIADTLNLDEREAVRRSRRVIGLLQHGCRARGPTRP
jgi:DNA-binding NarL/FixJ family response regulator